MKTMIQRIANVADEGQRMTSLEIAELTGKQHKNVMRDIRNMEDAWEKVQGLKFQLSFRTLDLPKGGRKQCRRESKRSFNFQLF